jgi:tungstate transport system ATP-binding protein
MVAMKPVDPIYQIQDITHRYNGKIALRIELLNIQPNTITGFIGPNGSGKSTLLQLMAFIEKPSEGKIYFKGSPAEPFSDNVRFQVSLLKQEPYLLKRTVFRNVSYGLVLRGARENLRDRVYEALALAGLPGHRFANRKWYELSGGEAQRVALAARLILKPEVLILDEPTASIDAASAQIIKDTVLTALRRWGTTLIIASHDWEWLYDICDTIMHLFRGRLFGSGRENFLFGPWEKLDHQMWAKKLHDGQQLLVPPPPAEDAVATIDPEKLLFYRDNMLQHRFSHTIQGVLTRLMLEKSSQQLLAAVQVSNQNFTVRVPPDTLWSTELLPGMTVRLNYDIRSINWY